MLYTLRSKVTKGAIKKKQPKDPFAIPLRPVASKTVENTKTITFKLSSQLSNSKSQTYKIISCVFTEGTPEEWIEQQKDIHKVFAGQAITTGPDQFSMTRQLLADKALTDFEARVTTHTTAGVFTETCDNLKVVLMDISTDIFPERAI